MQGLEKTLIASEQAFFGFSALLFAVSAAVTIIWCASMSAMGEMPMPGGWTMSMAWMRMAGETWPRSAASFLGMWVVMMVAMMMPSLVPMLWRYRQAVDGTGETLRLGLHCGQCCAGLIAILLVVGFMDLRAMAVVGTAIAVERLAPTGERIARAIGAVVVGAGLFLIARAGLG